MTLPARGLEEKVGPYSLVRAIGAGGSARIDLARIDRAYGFVRHVVIKRPLEHLRSDQNVAASLRREARIGGQLRHPNLVAVLDAGRHDNYDYLVLEYIQGTSLRELMQVETNGVVRTLPVAVALGIVIDVARGLHEAHELSNERKEPLGLVHRDISPANVLLGLDGSVKLADFGIAKETRVTTLSGSMHGTVTYMAPEQCRGHAFDRRADIWALGVILYELVTRQRLFWADNDVASLHKVLSGQIVRPRKLDPNIPAALDDIVMTALAQDPHQRFENAKVFANALEAIAAQLGLVVGARWIARSVEEVAGSRPAPWIPSSTVVDLPVLPKEPETSLVAVLQRLEEDEPRDGDGGPLLPTFGVVDARASEEGSVPNVVTAITPRTSRLGWVIAAALVVGVGIGAAVAITPQKKHRDQPAPPIATPSPAPPLQPPIVQTPDPAAIEAAAVGPSVPTPTPAPAIHRKHKLTNPPAAGSNADVAIQPIPDPEPQPTTGSGSAANTDEPGVPRRGSAESQRGVTDEPGVPRRGSAAEWQRGVVEWKPTMLLPTDSGKTKQP
jgi:eukaryotic-like serine/threonine-protein kinase